MEACPHCGFVNKPTAVRCECCLSELGNAAAEAAPAPFAAPKGAAPAPIISQPPAPITPGEGAFEPGMPAGPATGEPFPPPPPISAEVGGKSAGIIIALIVVGVLGGLYILRPQPGRESFASKIRQAFTNRGPATAKSEPSRRTTPAEPVAASKPEPSVPEARRPVTQPGPGAKTPAAPAAPAVAAPAPVSREDDVAEAQYQIAVNMLGRKQTTAARKVLAQLLEKYPKSKIAPDARDLLSQLPAEPSAPAASGRTTAPAAQSGARPAEVPSQPVQQEAGLPKGREITADDLRSVGRPSEGGRKVSIPASLQPQTPSSQPGTTSPLDNVILSSASYEQGQLVLNLDYNLASQHSRKVFLGAWMRGESVSRRLGYTASPMTSGRGSTKVILPDIPPNLSSLRIVFFEENGQLFFTKDFTISK